MVRATPFTIEDLKTHSGLERVLRQFDAAIGSLSSGSVTPPVKGGSVSLSALSQSDLSSLAALIRSQLQAPGGAPLNLQSLLPAAGSGTAVLIEDTHANRVTSYPAANYTIGVMFLETDRNVLYEVQLVAGVNTWVYAAGTMVSGFASLPNDLGISDNGFTFMASDSGTQTMYGWISPAWIYLGGVHQALTDAVTAATSDILILTHRSTGVPAAGFGDALLLQMENAINVVSAGARIKAQWTNAASGSETSSWTVQIRNAGAALADWFQVLISGIRFNVGGFFGKFVHANSADRTYTLADADGNLVYETSALTDHAIVLGNAGAKVKPGTLGTSTTVLHGAVAGDPTYSAVDLTADVTGILPFGNGGTGVSYNRIANTVALTGQVAAIGSTNFSNGGTAGTYRASYYLEDTALDLTAGTIQLQITFTDAAGSVTVSSSALPLTALGRTSGVFFIQLQSGSIAYSTALVGIVGTAQYALYICLERLS